MVPVLLLGEQRVSVDSSRTHNHTSTKCCRECVLNPIDSKRLTVDLVVKVHELSTFSCAPRHLVTLDSANDLLPRGIGVRFFTIMVLTVLPILAKLHLDANRTTVLECMTAGR